MPCGGGNGDHVAGHLDRSEAKVDPAIRSSIDPPERAIGLDVGDVGLSCLGRGNPARYLRGRIVVRQTPQGAIVLEIQADGVEFAHRHRHDSAYTWNLLA